MWIAIRHNLGLHQMNGIINWYEINEEATMYNKRIDGLNVGQVSQNFKSLKFFKSLKLIFHDHILDACSFTFLFAHSFEALGSQ